MDYGAVPEVQRLRAASPEELRSIVIVLIERAGAVGSSGRSRAMGEDPMPRGGSVASSPP